MRSPPSRGSGHEGNAESSTSRSQQCGSATKSVPSSGCCASRRASRSGRRVSGFSTETFRRRWPGTHQAWITGAHKSDKRTVPGTGGPDPHEASVEGTESAATTLRARSHRSACVAWVFLRLGLVPFDVAFGGVAAILLLIFGWALYRKRRGEQQQ